MRKSLKGLIYWGVIVFLLNFLWETGQAGLYQPHYEGTSSFVLAHLKAALGDVVIVAVIYLIITLSRGSKNLVIKINKTSLLLLALLGFISAVILEKYALATGRWAYNDLMPILPILKVGLTPIFQLTLLTPISVYFALKRKVA